MPKRVKIIVSVVTAVFVLSTVGATVAVMAQEGETEPQPAEESSAGGLLARIAAILGISEETLTGAFRQARQEMTDEALAEGWITGEQTGEIKAKREQIRDRIRHAFMFKCLLTMDEQELDEALAEAVDEERITGEQAEQIKARWEQRHQALEGDSTRTRIMRAVGGRRMITLCGGMQRMRLHRLAD